MDKKPKKPKVKLTDEDGNIFSIGGRVRVALKEAGQGDKIAEFTKELFACHDYQEALCVVADYVEVY